MNSLQKEQTSNYTPDQIDLAILKLLQENAKLTVREVASKVHLSPTPVHDRIKRLEQNGVIKKYSAILNNRKVNKSIMVICYVSLKEHNKTAGTTFIESVIQFKEVIECYNVSGEFDFMLKILAESMESYHAFHVDKLSEIPGIAQTKSIFVMNTFKETHEIL